MKILPTMTTIAIIMMMRMTNIMRMTIFVQSSGVRDMSSKGRRLQLPWSRVLQRLWPHLVWREIFENKYVQCLFHFHRIFWDVVCLHFTKARYFRSEMELDPQLVDPICEGSIVQVTFELLVFIFSQGFSI